MILKPPLGAQLIAGHPLSTGLVAFWLMNAGGGNTTTDLIGGLVGSLDNGQSDVQWAGGKFGPSLLFDGVDLGGADPEGDVVQFPVGPIPISGLTDGCTVLIWFKYTGDLTSDAYLIQDLDGDNDTVNMYIVNTTGRLSFQLIGATAVNNADTVITVNQWHQGIGTWDGTTVRMYLDTVPSGETQAWAGPNASGVDSQMAFGGRATQGFFPGSMDHVAMWDRALTVSEIASLYMHPFQMLDYDDIALFSAATQGGGAPPAGIPIFRRRRAG